ncbi:MAG: CBS domain-containing protein [Alphaproteobacteria bacterium]|nr:CBS domain-containing protein [Alphaproteobacteria bacterium]
MRAVDVMTTDVITVDPDTTVQALAALLAERGISGTPVVEAGGRLVGIVSEGDLLHRAEIGTARRHRERRRSWWLDHYASDLAREYIKSHGRTVKDIMTRDVVSVTEDIDLGEVAALLEAKRIKRVPVVRDGKVIGIISRANLVRALGTTKGTPQREDEGDDRTIRSRLLTELGREQWAKVWSEDVIVRDGVVHFWISSDEPDENMRALRVAAENIPGVRGIEVHLVPVPMTPAF